MKNFGSDKRPYSIRDLTIIPFTLEENLVIACDSIGAIGPKAGDVVKVSGYIVGRFLARVPLLELIAFGANPIAIIDTLSVEWDNTGKEILRGIRDELRLAGLDEGIITNGSTEENVVTRQTGAGITALGTITNKALQKPALAVNDELILVGLPKVGEEVCLEDKDMIKVKTVLSLVKNNKVKEIVPVGSKGISYEVGQLTKNTNIKENLTVEIYDNLRVNLQKSGGPATSILLVGVAGFSKELNNLLEEPVLKIGEINDSIL